VPITVIDGISTRYEVTGDGPPLLMFSPGGFGAELENWTSFSIYRRLRLMDELPAAVTCIMFDRRESGRSGGRVQRIGWADYAAQGLGLLDHLGLAQAHLIGGCVGCSAAAAFAVRYPDRTLSLSLLSPAGGPRYRMRQQARFDRHLAFAADQGLAGVVALAAQSDQGFSADPRLGPWVTVLRTDPDFARAYAAWPLDRYQLTVAAMARTLFDRDTAPGPEPEELMALGRPALILPGADESHAASAARYFQECLDGSLYLDLPVPQQTKETVPPRLLDFLAAVLSAAVYGPGAARGFQPGPAAASSRAVSRG
jgi:pimeloyl-ACP methyl ester carboxylesterase